MESYIRNILSAKTKSPATLKNRTAYIFLLYRLLDSNASDLSFLNDKKAVMALVKNSENKGSQKTRLFHIFETIKADKSKSVKPEVKDYYGAQAEKLKKPVAAMEADNVMNSKQKENHISIASANLRLEEHLKKLYADYKMDKLVPLSSEDFDRINNGSDRKNIFTFAKGVQECLIAALYVWQTALRNDWSELQITRKIVIPNTGNWLQIARTGKMTLILNEYKTAKYMGKVKIPLALKLNQLMAIWLDVLERITDEKPIHPLYYSINAKGKVEWLKNSDTLAKELSRISVKIFARPATINTFRHAHEIQLQESDEYRRMTVGEKKAAHAQLLHGLETGLKYNLQRRD